MTVDGELVFSMKLNVINPARLHHRSRSHLSLARSFDLAFWNTRAFQFLHNDLSCTVVS